MIRYALGESIIGLRPSTNHLVNKGHLSLTLICSWPLLSSYSLFFSLFLLSFKGNEEKES